VAATIGLLGPLSQVVPLDEAVSSFVLLVGLAVGVDYSMFYLRREMEERDAGRTPEAALNAAAATSRRAVLISGFTVMVAMAGMFLAGSATFTSFAVATILVVAVSVIGSLTVLPALLSKLGDKVEKGRVPFIARRRHKTHGESRVWGAILGPRSPAARSRRSSPCRPTT
jgi:RND superfamily putative drug exporter